MIGHRVRRIVAALAACIVMAVPFASSPSLAAAPPSDGTADILRGCWSLAPVTDGRGRLDTYCFNSNGFLSGASIANGLGGDFCVRWEPDRSKALLLYFGPKPDSCGFAASPDGQSFDLSACREAGHFRRDADFDLTSWPCDASSLD